MKKLFLSFIIINSVLQFAYAMDRELIAREGVRVGLSIGGGALIGLGLQALPDKYDDSLLKIVFGEVGILLALPACINVAMSVRSNSFWHFILPAFYGLGGCSFALKKYQDYLDTKLPVNINELDKYNNTPLIEVIGREKLARINLLLENKADPNARGGYKDETPLIYAVSRENPNLGVINALLANNAYPNRIGGWRHSTPLMYAVNQDNLNLDVINLLFENKADPNVRDKHNYTPLIYAVDRGNPDLGIIGTLLENKADPNMKGGWQKAASLMYAVSREKPDLEVIKVLFQYNANPNMSNKYDETPLMCVVRENANLSVINLLLENKADLGALISLPPGRYESIFDIVLSQTKPQLELIEIIIAHILKLAQQNNFSIFDRKFRDTKNEIVFYKALDDNDKTVFDYAVEHKNRQAIVKFLSLVRNTERFSFKGLRYGCMSCLAKNLDKIDLENSETVEKLRDVFYVLTAHYRTQNPEIASNL